VSCALGTVAAGEIVTVTIVANVDASYVTDGNTSPILNTATALATTPDPDPANDAATAETVVETSADLTISKVDDPDPVVAGAPLTYTITVENEGPSDAESVVVTDEPPAEVTVTTAQTDRGDPCDLTVSCDLGVVAAGETVTITVVGTVAAEAPDGTITNLVSVVAATADPDARNNDATADTEVLAPSIGLAKAVPDVPVNNGDGTFTVTYSVLVENFGSVDLTGLQVTDDLAGTFGAAVGFAVDSVTSPNFAVNPGYDGSTDVGFLDGSDALVVGELGTIEVVVTVEPGAFLGPYENSAVGTGVSPAGLDIVDVSQSGTDPDPDGDGDPTNNDEPTPVTFGEQPALEITKTFSMSPMSNGDGTHTLGYEIIVTNAGDIELRDLQVVDDLASAFALADGFVVDSVISPDLTVNPAFDGAAAQELLAGTDTLAVGVSAVIQITVTVTPGFNLGPYANAAVADAVTPAGTLLAAVSETVTLEFQPDAVAGGIIWWDDNRNGALDPDEVGLSGVVVNLYEGSGGSLTLVTTVTTGPDGTYQFTGLTPGVAYIIEVNASSLPEGFTVVTFSGDGGADLVFGFIAGDRIVADFGVDQADQALPVTGANIAQLTRLGVALSLLGGLLLLGGRRRREDEPALG
jgi:uncharacterized repeat protein (TIGR01451 family)